MTHDQYESPLASRYSSREMSVLFSSKHRIVLFRKLWICLASAEKKLGLKISDRQIKEMRSALDKISIEKTTEYEKRFRHDVMAHIHAFGDECPSAKAIIHLGATSTYVTDNADLIQIKEALQLLIQKLSLAIRHLSAFAKKHQDTPCLGFTHYLSAQPTTVGKRACLWLQDLLMDALEWERIVSELPFLGAKGATGTQASFLALFNGDEEKVKKLESLIANDFGFKSVIPIASQTYPRKIDIGILHALASFASGVHKMATDVRLLSHDQELFEARLDTQVGSSAMPYKQNPIYAERMCSLARFLMSLSQNPAQTLAVQWLERTLDDSANRRIVIAEAFLTADAILNVLVSWIEGLRVNKKTIQNHLDEAIVYLMMENVLMEAVKRGASRQSLHEKLRRLSHLQNLTPRSIAADPSFKMTEKEIASISDLKNLVGRAPQQVQEFLNGPVHAFLKRHTKVSVKIPPLEI